MHCDTRGVLPGPLFPRMLLGRGTEGHKRLRKLHPK